MVLFSNIVSMSVMMTRWVVFAAFQHYHPAGRLRFTCRILVVIAEFLWLV